MALSASDYEIVRQTAFLRGVSPDALKAIVEFSMLRRFKSGHDIFRQGEPASGIVIVLEGWVKLFRIAVQGEEAVISIFTKGQSFAEAAVFGERRYPAAARTVTATRMLWIPADRLIAVIRQSPDIALAMLASTAQHLHFLVHQIEQLKAQTGAQRLAEFLVSLCDAEEGPCRIELPYDKSLIAGRLGMKPESLSRSFARLRSEGVRVDLYHVHVADVRTLVDFQLRERILQPRSGL